MAIFLLCLMCQFSIQYKQFLNSPESEVVFRGLTRKEYRVADFADNPVILWFWRSNTGSAEADSFLKKIHLRKNFHLSAVLRWEAKEAQTDEEKMNKLNLAVHFDSTAIENFFSILSLAIKNRDLQQIKSAFALPILTDFRSQLFLISNIILILAAAVFMCGVVYVLIKTIHYLPAAAHRLGPEKGGQMLDVVKTIVLLSPIIIFRNLYLIFICYALLLIFIMDRQEKNWLRLNLIVLIIMFVLSLPVNSFISFLKEHNYNYQVYEMINYDNSLTIEPNGKNRELIAYGLKQQGNLERALSLYEELYYSGNRNLAVVNNLANIYFLYNEDARAESLYNYAILSGNRGEPYFNLGLLKLKNIEYSESSRLMEEARKRNFSSLLKEPVDIKPGNTDFYKMVFSEKLRFNGLIKFIYVVPLVIILILSFLPFKFTPPFYCATCGKPICGKCLKEVDDEVLCETCFTKFKSTKRAETEEELRRAVSKSRRRLRRFILYAVNLFIPGAGLIYINRHLTGFIIIFFVILGYVPLLFPRIFVKPAGWIAIPFSPIFILIAMILALFSYIISFLIIKECDAD